MRDMVERLKPTEYDINVDTSVVNWEQDCCKSKYGTYHRGRLCVNVYMGVFEF